MYAAKLCALPLALLLLSCQKETVSKAIEGNWRITNTAILLTSFGEEKESFYNDCKGEGITVENDKIQFAHRGKCFDVNEYIELTGKNQAVKSKLPVYDADVLFEHLYAGPSIRPITNDERLTYYSGFIKGDKEQNPVVVIRIDEKTIVLYRDPYYLLMHRQ